MARENNQGSDLSVGLRPLRGLTAEDDSSCLSALPKAFCVQDVCAISCGDGRQAWGQVIRHSHICMVVVNWMLSGLDGHEACRRHRPVPSNMRWKDHGRNGDPS